MPQGFPKTPDAFNERKTLKGTESFFYTKMSLEQIKAYYRKRMPQFGLEEVNPNTVGVGSTFVIEFSGWPSRERLQISATDESFYSMNNQRWVSARLIPLN